MRSIVQRVSQASVTVDGKVVGQVGAGLLVLCGAHMDDTEASAAKMADRVWGVRIFSDAEGKMNLALRDLVCGQRLALSGPKEPHSPALEERGVGQRGPGSGAAGRQPQTDDQSPPAAHCPPPTAYRPPPTYAVLAVSNFTVYGDTSQRRPSFVQAAPYEMGRGLFDHFVDELRNLGCHVETGEFGAHMEVSLVNDGPVTVIVET